MSSSKFHLSGKTAIVTGAANGLGKAMALALAAQGAQVVIADIDQPSGRQTAAEIAALGGSARFVKADIRSDAEIQALVDASLELSSQIDILVNNAGIGRPAPSVDVTRQDWQDVIDLNLTAMFFVSQAVGRVMIRQHAGSIVNIASISAATVYWSVPQTSYYTAKAGVVMMTKSLAAEWAPYNIRVNAIAPGVMETARTCDMRKDSAKAEQWLRFTPLGRFGEPQELGGAVVYLASDASSYTTGHVLVVDGGCTVY